MERLWTWSGSPFGYRTNGELWTYGGRHVGRFLGEEVYGPDGFYLGEIINDTRLIVDPSKRTQRTRRFRPLPDTRTIHPGFGFNKAALPAGFEDFPRPSQFL